MANDSSPGVGDVAALALLAVAAATMPRTTGAGPAAPAPRAPATTRTGWQGRVDLALQRHPVTAFPVAVVRKFADDRAGRGAALIAYYGFFSVFPAMLALVTVLGFVLDRDPALRDDIAGSALSHFPVVGDSIAATVGQPLAGNPTALVIGLVGALWAGMGTVQAAQDAMNEVWAVERVDYPGFVAKRLRSLVMLVALGLMVVASFAISQVANVLDAVVGPTGAVSTAALFAGTVAVDVAMFGVAYRVLTVEDVGWRTVLPGAALAGTLYAVLQFGGGLYVRHVVNGASDTYGTFAVVIGMLSWIFLIAQVLVIGAEVNVVAARRLWPRSLFTEPATEGDERSLASQATSQRMDPAMDVDVDFDADRHPDPGGPDERSSA